jgi:choline-glycine betaine transporter
MKYIWLIVNIGLVILSVFNGYSSMSPERLQHMNPDIVFCSLIFVIMPLFALGTVLYSVKSKKCETLQRPSWIRNPINWWYDPLQSLFVCNLISAAMAIGSALRLSKGNETGFWLFVSYCCMAIGLLIGRLLVYRIFTARIVKS